MSDITGVNLPLENSLELHELSCERDDRLLFEKLNFQFRSGTITQIAGQNGAGKTTLIKIITGLSFAFEGEVRWNGRANNQQSLYSSLLYHGHFPGVKTSLTPLENLNWYFGVNGSKISGSSDISVSNTAMYDALHRLGLKGYEDVPCSQMSAGQQRRVALARLFCSSAPVWILDEPLTAIDKQGVAHLEEAFQAHSRAGGIVVLTTHQPLNIEAYQVLDLDRFKPSANLELAPEYEKREGVS